MRKRRKRVRYRIVIIVIILCLCGIIFSSYNLLIWKKNSNKNAKLKEKVDTSVTIINDNDNEDIYKVDFDTLKKNNPDTVAYIKVFGTYIDYVVVKAEDNKYYLNHDFSKHYNALGWVFADYRNNYDGNDKNLVIYGHNVTDGSMFGSLNKTLEREWQNDVKNQKILLITEDSYDYYQVFSTYMINPEEYYINTNFKNDDEYNNFLVTIRSRSNYNYDTDISVNDNILTLSTCNATGAKRVVLHAKKIIKDREVE